MIGTSNAERTVDLKEVNLEERLAARKEHATANLYDESWPHWCVFLLESRESSRNSQAGSVLVHISRKTISILQFSRSGLVVRQVEAQACSNACSSYGVTGGIPFLSGDARCGLVAGMGGQNHAPIDRGHVAMLGHSWKYDEICLPP